MSLGFTIPIPSVIIMYKLYPLIIMFGLSVYYGLTLSKYHLNGIKT